MDATMRATDWTATVPSKWTTNEKKKNRMDPPFLPIPAVVLKSGEGETDGKTMSLAADVILGVAGGPMRGNGSQEWRPYGVVAVGAM